MGFLWRALYNIILVPLFLLSARIYMLFNSKARAGLAGRKGMFKRLSESVSLGSGNVVWFHCSSVGEVEQAKPIIAALDGRAKIVISVFSPSGYDAVAKYPDADLICYIPFDSARNARS